MSKLNLILISIAGMLCSLSVASNIDIYEFTNEENRSAYIALTKELRCPKCQNQDIADSNAPIASDMRREVHRLVEEGQSHEQVVTFMIERFGDFVTYKPKKDSATFMLWYGPWLFIGLGLVIIMLTVKRPRSGSENKAQNKQDTSAASKHDKVNDLLNHYGDKAEKKVDNDD